MTDAVSVYCRSGEHLRGLWCRPYEATHAGTGQDCTIMIQHRSCALCSKFEFRVAPAE